MENKIKYSVICPMYNSEKYIGETIDSLSNTNSKDFEFILVDDCSTDNSIENARKKLRKVNFKYQIIKNSKNLGPYLSRIKGINKSNGEYLIFLDSDDLLHKQYFECLAKVQNINSNIDCLVVNTLKFAEKPKEDEISAFNNFEIIDSQQNIKKIFYINANVRGLSNIVVKKDCVNLNIYNFYGKYGEDYLFICHFVNNLSKIVITNLDIYLYRKRNESLSSNIPFERFYNFIFDVEYFVFNNFVRNDDTNTSDDINFYLIRIKQEINLLLSKYILKKYSQNINNFKKIVDNFDEEDKNNLKLIRIRHNKLATALFKNHYFVLNWMLVLRKLIKHE